MNRPMIAVLALFAAFLGALVVMDSCNDSTKTVIIKCPGVAQVDVGEHVTMCDPTQTTRAHLEEHDGATFLVCECAEGR